MSNSSRELDLNKYVSEFNTRNERININDYLKHKPFISSREPINSNKNSVELLPSISLETSEFIKFNLQPQTKVEEFLNYQFNQKDNLNIIEGMLNEVDISYLKLKPAQNLPKVRDYKVNSNTRKCAYSDHINEVCKLKLVKKHTNTSKGNSNMGLVSKNPLDLIDNIMVKNSKLEKLITSTKNNPRVKNSIKRSFEDSQSDASTPLLDKASLIKESPELGDQSSVNSEGEGDGEGQKDLHDSFQGLSLDQLITHDNYTLEDDLTQMHILEELVESFTNFMAQIVKEEETMSNSMEDGVESANSLLVRVEGYPTLSNLSIKKLDNLFTKLISYKLMEKLDIDLLVKLVELLKFTIDSVNLEFLDFNQIKDSKKLPNLEVEKLEENELLLGILNGLIASNLLLQISLIHPQNTKLNNEDLVLSSIKLIKHQLTKTLLTCLESFNLSTNGFVVNLKTKKVGEYRRMIKLLNLINLQLTSYLTYFSDLLKLQELNNEIIIGIGYCAILMVFLDTSQSTSIFTNVAIDTIKSKCSNLVKLIFIGYEDQRDWILDEVLNSLIKLPLDKRLRKDIKLSNGSQIQMTSAFLLELVQCNFSNLTQFSNLELPNLYEFLKLDNFSNLDLSLPLLNTIQGKMKVQLDESLKISKSILNYFLTKLSQKQSNLDSADYKQLFMSLIEDFLVCLDLPEWQSSELLLRLISIVLIGSNYWLTNWILHVIQVYPDLLQQTNKSPKVILLRSNLLKILQNLLNEDELTKSLNLSENMRKSNISLVKLLNLKLIGYTQLTKLYPNICSTLIKSIDLQNINLRSKALRSISNLNTLDSKVLNEELLNDIIIIRLNDNSASIRDIAIDILGKFILSNPSLGENYLQLIFKRVQDTSLMVRKRSIKLLSQLYYKFDDIQLRIGISQAIFKGLSDLEASIKLLTVKTLKEFWFSRLNSYTKEEGEEDQVYIEYKFLPLVVKKEINSRIQIIIGLVKNFSLKDTRVIGEFIFKTLKKPEVEKKELYEVWKFNLAICKYFIEGLLANLLHLEEVQNTSQVSSTICALHIFGIAAPKLFNFNHLSQLQNYLQLSPNSPDLKPLYFTLTILKNILPTLRFPKFSFLKGVENQILKIINNFSESILEVSLPCICTIVEEVTQHWKLIIALYKACFQRLFKLKSLEDVARANGGEVNSSNSNDKAVIRLLLIIGLLSRHIDIDSRKQELEADGVDFSFLEGKTFIQTTFDLIIYYLNPSQAPNVRSFAIRSLGLMFIKTPNLVLNPQVTQTIDHIFASNDLLIKTSLMKTFYEFISEDSGKLRDELDVLEDSEEKIQESINLNDLIGANNLPLDSGICANLMQSNLDNILKCLLSSHPPLINHSLNCVGILLTSGYCHPLKIIPSLVAVQTNSDPQISVRAIQFHMTMVSKYPSFIHSNSLDCIKSIFNYQTTKSKGFSYNEAYRTWESKLNHLFLSMSEVKQVRKEFINLILNNWDLNLIEGSSLTSMEFDFENEKNSDNINLNYYRFLAESLTTLDYKNYEDIIFLIYQINQLLSISCSQVLDRVNLIDPSNLQESKYWAKLSILYSYLLASKFYLIEKFELDPMHFNLIVFETKKVKEKTLQMKKVMDPSKFWNNYTSPDVILDEVSVKRCFEHLRQLCDRDAESVKFEEEDEEESNGKSGKVGRGRPKKVMRYDEDSEDEYVPN
ncbi:ARM repeat-containing protein [Conidiobolus coronatus NRRL 28638]|uniref:Sister chromatid cohesion protein n=1 Tax=Conidiobolus coronatus (strain ATCC 28846 / CBS 209.66 / NRRL 28638) TaxID=796925 RepID=A0A137PDI4_CONC2|nr:ARM repeat-containing protein [Conidiobolus coronatus NRRL 28638]|eukprot:KXN73057.1 ARM repeat-containing protein [Conidiobolus coronatus NRRL 28638]